MSLILVVCWPYLRRKCEMYIDQLHMKYKLELKEVIKYIYDFIFF